MFRRNDPQTSTEPPAVQPVPNPAVEPMVPLSHLGLIFPSRRLADGAHTSPTSASRSGGTTPAGRDLRRRYRLVAQ